MLFLISGIALGVQIVGTGILLKIGNHVGKRFLESCGENEIISSSGRRKHGANQAAEQTSGEHHLMVG